MDGKYASDYPLPGGVEQYFDTLIALLRQVGDKTVQQDELINWMTATFPGTKGATACSMYLASVSRGGLWSIKDGEVHLTTEGSKLIEQADENKGTARRIVWDQKLCRIAGYDDIVLFMATGSQTLDDVDVHLKGAIDAVWKSKNQTTFRLNWLRSLGYVKKDGQRYGLTKDGTSLAEELLQSKPLKPPTDVPPPPPTTSAMVQEAATLGAQLEAAALKGLDGAELENVTANAFSFLGFEAIVVSGPGNPDVVLTAPMGEAAYRVIIDTKSRSSGTIQQNDVNFNALKEHKKVANTDYVMVLGANFSGGNLEKWAQGHLVRLFRVEELRQLLAAHAEAVIALDRLEDLFRGGGSTDEAVLSEILADSEHTVQSMSLARVVYDAVRSHQDQEGTLNADSIYFILGGEHAIQDIEATVSLLQSDLVAALGESDKGSLYTRLTPQMLNDRFEQLKDVIGSPRENCPNHHPN